MYASYEQFFAAPNLIKTGKKRPRFEVLGRWSTKHDQVTFTKFCTSFRGQSSAGVRLILVVRVRAEQGYSTAASSELLAESREKANRKIRDDASLPEERKQWQNDKPNRDDPIH